MEVISNKENEYVFALWKPFVYSMAKPHFYRINELPNYGFSSLYYITQSQANQLESTGSKGFKGSVWSERLWLDFDSQAAGQTALTEIRRNEWDFICYSSGRRGFHIGLLRKEQPSEFLPAYDKRWARKYFPDCDTSIYSHLHLFRRPGDRHETTGRRKSMVSQAATGQPIPPLASEEIADTEQRLIQGLLEVALETPDNNKSIFDDLYIRSLSTPRAEGDRHPTLVKLAFALQRRGYGAGIALFWLEEVNKLYTSPKGSSELDKIVRDIYG